METGPGARLDILDGMRGVAALLVVVYHVFVRWAEPNWPVTLYPHGNALIPLPWLAVTGEIGIFLFFMISGFVILMTLERSSGLLDFTVRRAARLWPAMLVCATLSALLINTSGIAGYFGVARWSVHWPEYLWSLVFIPPDLGMRVFVGAEVAKGYQWVEGVYWTLWAEVRFYTLAGLVFLAAGPRRFLWAWLTVQATSTALELWLMLSSTWSPAKPIGILLLMPRLLGWFSLGVCGYAIWTGRRHPAVPAIAVLAVIAIVAEEIVTIRAGALYLPPEAPLRIAGYGLTVLPFVLFLCRSRLVGWFALPPVVAIGLASYPLYLFHERPVFVGMMLGERLGVPPLLATGGSVAVLIGIALAIHAWVEQPVRRHLVGTWRRRRDGVERRVPWLRFPAAD